MKENTETIENVFYKAAGQILELEIQTKRHSPEHARRRIRLYREKWPEILGVIEENLPSLEETRACYDRAGAVSEPGQINVREEQARQAVLYARELRDRFTVLQMLGDLQLDKPFAERLTW